METLLADGGSYRSSHVDFGVRRVWWNVVHLLPVLIYDTTSIHTCWYRPIDSDGMRSADLVAMGLVREPVRGTSIWEFADSGGARKNNRSCFISLLQDLGVASR